MLRTTAISACLLLLALLSPAHAASEKAQELRKADGLVAFTPPDSFLAGLFIADEMEPHFLFGTVKDFQTSRKCPTAWLIEEGEKARIGKPADSGAPLEYTLYLEEDCPGGVVHYVFVDQSAMTPQQWIEWRKQFHKSKAEGEYGATRERMEKAVSGGSKMGGELRFIMVDGQLGQGKTPEQALRQDMNFQPCYDLKQGAKLGQ
ncbi:hypothetical protein [Fundidesulfovibrio agrisoli]|uniref:hypothetical protein n=1 Tax=Fundidesulfovibrio agrisoli TaxID=2922717 RepID=UPI001FADD140|nr:hypothetical protein [Fundidesulfovibrio agrisoli]